MKFDPKQLERWMSLVRTHPDGIQAFWPSQIQAKAWIVDVYRSYRMPTIDKMIIFGSWYGVLADMFPWTKEITCVDAGPERYLEWCSQKYSTWGGCMSKYAYESTPDVVINTVTEHVSQEIYDEWFENIPEGVIYIVQGNNDTEEPDHIRACKDLDEFKRLNTPSDTKYMNSLPRDQEIEYEGPWDHLNNKKQTFKRFMLIGEK